MSSKKDFRNLVLGILLGMFFMLSGVEGEDTANALFNIAIGAILLFTSIAAIISEVIKCLKRGS